MMLERPNPHIQEALSRAYIQAVAAKAGATVRYIQQGEDYGLDGTFRAVIKHSNRFRESGMGIDFQLKSTFNYHVEEDSDSIVFDLKVGTYNDLVEISNTAASKVILILYCMPRNENLWLAVNNKRLLLRRCCYWRTFLGENRCQKSSTMRIRIPRKQLFTPDTLIRMLK